MAMTGGTMVGLGSALMSREGSLSCHTCYDTGPWVCGLIPKDCLNVVASYEKQGNKKSNICFSPFFSSVFALFLTFFSYFLEFKLGAIQPPPPEVLHTRTFFISVPTVRRRSVISYEGLCGSILSFEKKINNKNIQIVTSLLGVKYFHF